MKITLNDAVFVGEYCTFIDIASNWISKETALRITKRSERHNMYNALEDNSLVSIPICNGMFKSLKINVDGQIIELIERKKKDECIRIPKWLFMEKYPLAMDRIFTDTNRSESIRTTLFDDIVISNGPNGTAVEIIRDNCTIMKFGYPEWIEIMKYGTVRIYKNGGTE